MGGGVRGGVAGATLVRTLAFRRLVDLGEIPAFVVGYAGRDPASVQRHIDELSDLGVAPPPEVPAVYPMPAGLVTTRERVALAGAHTSGEVEPVYVRTPDALYLGVGSDHTDRALERSDVAASKRDCPKPVSPVFCEVPGWDAVDWDACRIRSWVDGEPYQDASLGLLRPPAALLGIVAERFPGRDSLLAFGGTVPTLSGGLRSGRHWELRLDVPGFGSLTHAYVVEQRETHAHRG